MEGVVTRRTPETVNANVETGEVEVVADKLWILNESRTPPFPMEEEVDVSEEARLKFRYVDLRRPHMQRNIILRSRVSFAARELLTSLGFLEIETPFLTSSTPEGARDFLVPSRVQRGQFYALPQSPQIFKQLLMVSGFEKYFQIVRCFRDEDLRADRQPEFTQIDLEMSFPQQERIFEVMEPLVVRLAEVAGYSIPSPFPRLTHEQAMRSYGIDKPDLRIPPFHAVEDLFAGCGLTGEGLPLVAIVVPKTGALMWRERDELRAYGQERGLRVYDDVKRLERDFPQQMAAVRARTSAGDDDLLLLCGWPGEAKGPAPRLHGVPGVRPVAFVRRAEVQRPPQAARPARFPLPLGGRFPDVRVGPGGGALGGGAPSVHLSPRRGHREVDVRPRALPRQVLRPRAERRRTGQRVDPYSPPRLAGQSVRRPRHERRGGSAEVPALAGGFGIRCAAARRHRPRARPPGDDPGG